MLVYVLKVVEAINESEEAMRPAVLVSATAVGYYGMYLAPISFTYLYIVSA